MKVLTISRSSSRDRTGVIEIGLKSAGEAGWATLGMGRMIEVLHCVGKWVCMIDTLDNINKYQILLLCFVSAIIYFPMQFSSVFPLVFRRARRCIAIIVVSPATIEVNTLE